tara:strand:- start:1037 stop:1210 length:174 start_codon:yes stop_codon:yes gene_type:complete
MIKSKRLTTTVAPKKGPNSQVPPIKLNKGSKKEIKTGYHKMPNGRIMKDSEHKRKNI